MAAGRRIGDPGELTPPPREGPEAAPKRGWGPGQDAGGLLRGWRQRGRWRMRRPAGTSRDVGRAARPRRSPTRMRHSGQSADSLRGSRCSPGSGGRRCAGRAAPWPSCPGVRTRSTPAGPAATTRPCPRPACRRRLLSARHTPGMRTAWGAPSSMGRRRRRPRAPLGPGAVAGAAAGSGSQGQRLDGRLGTGLHRDFLP